MEYTVFHGTNCKFSKFNNSTTDETNKINEIWFTSDKSLATDYARERTLDLGGNITIINAIITINNPMPEYLKDGINQIFKYAEKEEELEEYQQLYNSFDGNEIIEFAEYVADKKYDTCDFGFLVSDWGFDGRINNNLYSVFSVDQIKIV